MDGGGNRDILAGEASADRIDANAVMGKSSCAERSDVSIDRDLWPVLREHASGEGFDFAERDSPEAARPFQSEGEPPDPAEQVE